MPAASSLAVQPSSQRGPALATAALASSSPRMANSAAITAHTPTAVPVPRRRYCAACQAAPVTGPAGITLASPVEASTRTNRARHGDRLWPTASNWRCTAAPQASDTTTAAAAAPSQHKRSLRAWANASPTSPAAGERTAAAARRLSPSGPRIHGPRSVTGRSSPLVLAGHHCGRHGVTGVTAAPLLRTREHLIVLRRPVGAAAG